MACERIEPPYFRTGSALRAGLYALFWLCMVGGAQAAPVTKAFEAKLHEAWRVSISSEAAPGSGCFSAQYPDTAWTRVSCATAPYRRYGPAQGPIVGGGHDYAAGAESAISSAVGSFPSISGLVSEKNIGVSDQYSLQLNTQYFNTPACQGSQNPPQCDGWQQFIFAQSGGKDGTSSVFMVYWLINYGPVCPSGWNQAALNCYSYSSATSVPHQKLSALDTLEFSGTVDSGGKDEVQLTTANNAYAASGSDAVLDLVGSWTDAEYNIFGDGGGSQANFNKGTKITVNMQLTDGTQTAPSCESGAIFTNETNNLNLRKCTGQSGKSPSIAFVESN